MRDKYDEQAKNIVDQSFNEFAECHDGVDMGAIPLLAQALREIGQDRDKVRTTLSEILEKEVRELRDVLAQRDSLKAKLKIARGALEFYADKDTWKATPRDGEYLVDAFEDDGELARQALAQIAEGK